MHVVTGAKSMLVGCVVGLAIFLSGCPGGSTKPDVKTPEGRKKVAYAAGQAAALSFLAAVNPPKEETATIKVVVDKVRDGAKGYQEKGFISALPEIELAIDKLFPVGQESRKIAAKKLAKILLEEMDKVFKGHPDWAARVDETAGLVGSFAEGASAGLG